MTNLYFDARPTERPEPLAVPERALTIGAHPDDAEFGAGATLAGWAASGCEVSMLIVTDGSKGTWDPSLEPERLVQIREQEQKRSAEVLGVRGEIVHLGYVDGELEYSMELRRRICAWIRKLRPNVVLGHDPWRHYMLHPDHRVAGFGAIDGVVAARDHLFFPDLGDKHRPDAILLWGADQPDYWEDISARFDQKIEALLCHSSQTITSMSDANADQSGREAFERRMLEWAGSQGSAVDLPFAESFKLLRP